MADIALPPSDQADGLRRLFAASRMRFVPLLANPHVDYPGLIIERLVTAFGECAAHTLVVDTTSTPSRMPSVGNHDLAALIEPLTMQSSVLPARGLPRRYVASNGSSASFLHAIADASPRAEVVLVHADAGELARMFADRLVRPIVLAADRPVAVTHAYAGIKLLATRARLLSHDLLLAAAERSPRSGRIAERMASCADLFLGAVLRDWAPIDPVSEADEPISPALRRLARDAVAGEMPAHDGRMPTSSNPTSGRLAATATSLN